MANVSLTSPDQVPIPQRASQVRFPFETILMLLPALILVVGVFVLPFLFGLNLSLHTGLRGEGEATLANYVNFFNDPSQVEAIWITFQVALPVTLFIMVVSIPLAYYMRRGIRFERLITTLLILPITLGNVMVAQAMLMYFGRQGWFNQGLQALNIIKQPLTLIHNWMGVEIALFIQTFPFAFLMILGYMSGVSPDLERASRMLGAKAWRTFWQVIWPLTLPGIAIAFCLTFVANFSVFPSAVLVGRPDDQTRVLSVVAFRTAYEVNNPAGGTAIAFIMGAIEFLVVVFVLWGRSRLSRSSTLGGGKGT
jgi:putative spermidine/putrescine transport system permease protein